MRPQLRDLGLVDPARKARHHEPLQPEPDIENIPRLFPGRRCDHGAAIAPEFHQPFGRKLPQRIAHDGAARAKAFTDRVLRQFCTRRQRLFHDGMAKGPIDLAGAVGGGLGSSGHAGCTLVALRRQEQNGAARQDRRRRHGYRPGRISRAERGHIDARLARLFPKATADVGWALTIPGAGAAVRVISDRLLEASAPASGFSADRTSLLVSTVAQLADRQHVGRRLPDLLIAQHFAPRRHANAVSARDLPQSDVKTPLGSRSRRARLTPPLPSSPWQCAHCFSRNNS